MKEFSAPYLPEPERELCNRAAEAAVTFEGTRLARLLLMTGQLGAGRGETDGRAHHPGPEESGRIGIWERKARGERFGFARSKDRVEEWNLWANVGYIPPKGEKRRVVLVGESVARGYLYDPAFTPAAALARILDAHAGPGRFEVVDLARIDLGFEVAELAKSAHLLEPDAVVIFAGNNWGPRSRDSGASRIARTDAVLRREGIAGLKSLAENLLAENVRDVVTDVSSFYKEKAVPLVWIVPEFNLADWRDPVTLAPHLAVGRNLEWLRGFEEAEKALAAGDPEKASELGRRLVEIDGGVSAAGFHLMAETHKRSGDPAGARACLESARDAVIWELARTTSPRPFRVTQEALRENVTGEGGRIVDMPAIFEEYLEGEIPGRRVFLDYCHLSAEGIRVAMAAAAARLVGLFERKEADWTALAGRDVAPAREVEGETAFLAAVHNAHWWQSYDVVHYFCRRSLELAPEMARVMVRFLDFQTRRAPLLMCRASQELLESASPLIQRYLLHHNNQALDPLLLSAVVASLEEAGTEAAPRLAELRSKEHDLERGPANLLDFYYQSAALQAQEAMWAMPKLPGDRRRKMVSYYTAYRPESAFVFVGEKGSPVRLDLTCCRPASSPARVVLEVNGRKESEKLVGPGWENWEILVAGETVSDGVNEVLLRWPVPEFPGEQDLETAADDLIDGLYPEYFPVFGKIHSFTAKAADPATVKESLPLP